MKLDISKLQYVIFDWDNTLAESRTALVFSINKVLSEYNLPDWDYYRQFRDPQLSFRDNFKVLFKDKADELYARYREVYLAHVKELITTFPFVCETLDFFLEHNIPMIVMSNKDRLLLDYELPLLFDPKTFLKVVAGHEAVRDKPYPEHIYFALQGLLPPSEITPQSVWMIGDSAQDSNCALAAKALPIRIGKPIWDDDKCENDKIIYISDFKVFLDMLK